MGVLLRLELFFVRLLIAPIKFYQYCVSPLFPAKCKFYPSCSNYAIKAIKCHGGGRGVFLAVKRVLRCHPFGKGGFDPVPEPIFKDIREK